MRPIDEMLRAAQGNARFHMPGHKGRLADIPAALDMTELSDTDDLFAPRAGIARAEALLARAAGAGASILVPGGATAGLFAMVFAFVRPGGRLLMRRDAHHAALSACVLAGVEPVLLPPQADVSQALERVQCDAVLLTRPDYYGRATPLPRTRATVLVDAAHGAHFSWWDAPPSAMRAGADCAVESAHKTLGALTGGAWLHVKDARQAPRLRRMLRMVSSSSPSFLILRSLDDARAWMDKRGRDALCALVSLCEGTRARIRALGLDCDGFDDPTRLYVRTDALGLTGWAADAQLRQMGVRVEMADARGVVAIATVYDRAEDFDRLVGALARLRPGSGVPAFPEPAYGEAAMSARAAALGRARMIPLAQAAGAVAAQAVGAYPPGCAIVAPGERFTRASVEFLLASRALGATLFGAEGERVQVVYEGEGEDV